uniref:Uncharacterized protein n=1 Tax=Amphora coffeiformis TaxID=265554 RepID=A0A7S3KZU2_9STRA
MTIGKQHKNLKTPTCVLDNTVVNADTLGNMTDLGLSFFATLCGRNRGAFVLDPSDGHTYGCTAFPSNFATLATGYNATTVPLEDANAIVKTFQQQNVSTAETVAYLDYLVKMVYHSTAHADKDPYACNTGGLSKLQCDPVNTIATIKAVTTAGLFVPVPWMQTPTHMTTAQRKAFYTPADFRDMKKAGLNTVQIPFPLSAFQQEEDTDADDATTTTTTTTTTLLVSELSSVLSHVLRADLQAILVLVGPDNDNAVTAAAQYAALHSDTLLGLTVPSAQSLGAARAAQPDLKLFVPVNQGEIKDLTFPDANTFGALDLTHTGTVGDVASSTPLDDRMKLYYHESLACVERSPLEFSACYRRVPLFVSQGFDLSIDDCVNKDSSSSTILFTDYGQCDRFDDTVDSEWWHEHRKSFADRQLFAYEQGMGWSFAAWKLYDDTSDSGTITDFAQLLSFKDVYAAGLMPSLDAGHTEACLNPPASDFVMGDATYAPTAAPVDCGYGWWNETTHNCSYWIPPPPPPPTAAPTGCPEVVECPTPEPCTACKSSDTLPAASSAWPPPHSTLASGGIGVAIGIVMGGLIGRYLLPRGRAGYTEIPSSQV